MLRLILILSLLAIPVRSAVLNDGVLAASDTSGTNATVRSVTITGNTNLNAGVLNATNDIQLNGTSIFSTFGGFVKNTGASTANAIPRYSDTTGTNISPTLVTVTSSTNLNVTGRTTTGLLTVTPPAADQAAITVSGGSTTGSGTTKAATFSHTANTSGNIDGVYTFTLVDTASGASTFHSKWLGGAAGTTVLASLSKSGAFSAADVITGLRYQTTATSGYYQIFARGLWDAPADGEFRFSNNGFTGFTSLTLGVDDASPNSATIKPASGVGTDIAGGSLTIAGGQGTGTGRGGALIGKTAPSGTTGSSANAYSERYHFPAKAVTLTESTATTIATIAVPAAKYLGGNCVVTVFASDATDHQSRTLTFPFSAINKAGTVTAGIGTPVESVAVSAGTLTATITAVANGNAVDIKVDATSSLTQTTLSAKVALTAINSNDTAAVTEI